MKLSLCSTLRKSFGVLTLSHLGHLTKLALADADTAPGGSLQGPLPAECAETTPLSCPRVRRVSIQKLPSTFQPLELALLPERDTSVKSDLGVGTGHSGTCPSPWPAATLSPTPWRTSAHALGSREPDVAAPGAAPRVRVRSLLPSSLSGHFYLSHLSPQANRTWIT